MKKTKVLFSGVNMDTLIDSSVSPRGVCRSGFGSNPIYYSGCKHCVHKKHRGFLGRLVEDEDLGVASVMVWLDLLKGVLVIPSY